MTKFIYTMQIPVALFIFAFLLCHLVHGERITPRITDGGDGLCKLMAEPLGYVCEEHMVTTEDGYILSLQRIPVGKSNMKSDKPPVLLQHGIMTDAAAWMLNSPDQSLSFILADNGFDVWLSNTRGTTYSSGHTSLSPSDPAYWDWTWDQLASYDLPALIAYVHDQTGRNLHYVGHSLGTLMALAALSEENGLNMEMLRSVALLSPIAYLGQIPAQPTKFAAGTFITEDLYWLGLRELIPGGTEISALVADACKQTHSNCSDLFAAFTGDFCCANSSKVYVLLEHQPQPTATKNVIHLSQMIREGTLAKYDYGNEDENKKHYGQPTPPPYNMTNIPNDFPLFLGHGGQDMLADVKDVQTLIDSLKGHNPDKLVVLFRPEYAHVDFVFGTNANKLVYDPLMDFFNLN